MALVVDAAAAEVDPALQLRERAHRGDPFVDHVDHAADGAGTVEQGAGTADHLDPIGLGRVGRYRVVGAHPGGVAGSDAAFEHPYAVAGEAANDGAAGARAEEGGADTGLTRQGFSEGRLQS